jgi:acyl-coenzyme A synthetase/AMP-(fatty) acid ligase
MNDNDDRSPIAPLQVRKEFAVDPELGAGNFLQRALDGNPHRDVPYAFTHTADRRGGVVIRGYSLVGLAARRDRYARWYWANGVRPGDVVALYIGEGLEPVLHFTALTALGAIAAQVNDAMPPAAAMRYLDHIGADGLVADDPTSLTAAFRADSSLRRPRFIVPAAEIRGSDPVTSAGLPQQYPHRHAPDDVVALIHSSGTTGTPKATMLGHRQFWDGKQPRMTRFPCEPYDKLMSLMPHTHAGGLSYFLTATLLGLPTIVMSGWTRDVVEPVMEEFQPTMVASFPRTFVELATGEPPAKAAASVHTWFNTGDSAHYGHIRRLVELGRRPAGLVKPWLLPSEAAEAEAVSGSRFIDGLGSSEMGMALFGYVTTPQTPRSDRCIGKPLEVVDAAAVLDVTGAQLPTGTAGLLGVKTRSRTPGYWNDPKLTASFESNGFWLTGDIARQDSEGNFYHLDRTLDVIDTSSGPVYSLELEEVLIADVADLVADGVVTGVAGQAGQGQVPVAVICLQPGVQVTEKELLTRANKALAAAGLATLAAVVIARGEAEYPTGPTGKALKRELRTRHATLVTSR